MSNEFKSDTFELILLAMHFITTRSFSNIDIQLQVETSGTFRLTVFDEKGLHGHPYDNKTYNFYTFYSLEENKHALKQIFNALETDNFKVVCQRFKYAGLVAKAA